MLRPTSATMIAVVACAAAAGAAQAATVSSFGGTDASPIGITLDSAGNVYTANWGSNSVSKLTLGGAAAGAPWPVFTGLNPWSVVWTDSGGVFTTNSNGDSLAGIASTTGIPLGAPWPVATGMVPVGVAADQDGNLYTTDAGSDRITKITRSGVATPFASPGAGASPYAVAFDQEGNLYTANFGDHTVSKFTAAGAAAGAPWPVSLGAGTPWTLSVDAAGNVYTADGSADTVSRITPAGAVTTFAVGVDPRAVTIDSAGNAYVTNLTSNTVSKITAAGGVTAAFASGGGLNGPNGIAIDSLGNLFVTNNGGNTVSKITPVGGDIQPAPPDRPDAPLATAGDGSATVTVPPNATDRRYGAPSSYTVAAVEDPARTCTVTPPLTACTVSGLRSGVAYTFTARANLNTWQTGASRASAAVTPTSAPAPTPGPSPAPAPSPTPSPNPSSTLSVTAITKKVTRSGASLAARVASPGAGVITQRATTGPRKLTTWCRVSKVTAAASTHTLTCNLGSRGRAALRKGALRLTLRTTFTPTAGKAVTVNRAVTIARRR